MTKAIKNLIAMFLGGLVGMVAFLVFSTYWLGHPFGDWFMSAHGAIGAKELAEASIADRVELYKLLSRGLIVTTDGVLSQMADLYGNLIQVLIGAFAVITVFGFFGVRWQSIQAAEDYVDKRCEAYFHSDEFRGLVRTEVEDHVDSLYGETNQNIFRSDNSALWQEILDLQNGLRILEQAISRTASSEEVADEDAETE
ncbi:H2-forming N5,N10-methylenetetrahydromethanopterin dehydrogenase-like enzyme [Agrobacterium pusense]|uniref:hypothetical protein n=1 Tax=Agrobacterium TaxID=357 RepID=UPI0013A6D83E|nr:MULTISPECIES: hypothetical protein [Agrobacterium]MDR6190357.1 H2-forming N5,N10-methylenetetrahydromethanopterin dehydrogenase-like enzyme [Agrobacterium pusense]UNZ52614.1 hypothetical protein MLE07_17700 [Agrobacterium tumefaciens]